MPAACATRLISRILAIETGCPPPELFVIVTMISGIFSGPCFGDEFFERADIHVAFEGAVGIEVVCLDAGQVERLAADEFDVAAGGIEVRVVGNDRAGLHHDAKQDVFRGAPLVRGNDLLESENVLDGVAKAVPAACAGVGLVATHHRGPGFGRHCARARVGQQVDDDVLGSVTETD